VSSASASLEAIPNRIAFTVTKVPAFFLREVPSPLRKASFEVTDVKARGVNLALQIFLETFLRCPVTLAGLRLDPREANPHLASKHL
jgi:hypothetical protein